MNVRDKALEIAITQLGQREIPKGSNRGPMVDQYLKSVGLDPGAAWCMGFVYWCYQQAAKALGLPNSVVKTAGVMDCWNRTAVNIKIHALEAKSRPELVSPGDQIIFKHANGMGHTGIVEKVIGQDVYTIEGNTNSDGSREGFEVERKKRTMSDPHLEGFIRYS